MILYGLNIYSKILPKINLIYLSVVTSNIPWVVSIRLCTAFTSVFCTVAWVFLWPMTLATYECYKRNVHSIRFMGGKKSTYVSYLQLCFKKTRNTNNTTLHLYSTLGLGNGLKASIYIQRYPETGSNYSNHSMHVHSTHTVTRIHEVLV